MSRMQELFLDTSGLDVAGLEAWGRDLAWWQRQINWYIGQLAIAAKDKLGDENYSQVFPPDVSPGLIQRCEAVARAYPPKDRNPLASWTVHMTHANKPNRIELVAASVDAGRTSDEEREHAKAKQNNQDDNRKRWLLAIDVNYFLHRFWYSGAGVESAVGVAAWITRTVERLKEKGLTDCAACFDSKNNHRKELTKDWEDKYKGNRGPKEPELAQQLNLVYDLIRGSGIACVSIEGYEADDCIASYAKKFPGKVAILSQDKDLKQCLDGQRVIMLRDVTWDQDETSGDTIPTYHWYTEKPHPRVESKNLWDDTGLTPQQFPEFQCLMGDATDCITGAPGIGEKGALNLIREFGSVDACIKAARNADERLLKMPRANVMAKGLLELEPKLEITRKLVTLVNSLDVPSTTRI